MNVPIPKNINENFYKWFKGSKTINELGQPIIFYHKSRSIKPFNNFIDVEFSEDKFLKNPYNDCGGIYFVAYYNKTNIDYIANGLEFYVFLNCKNPLIINEKNVFDSLNFKTKNVIIDMNGVNYDYLNINKPFIEKCKKDNYDSIFIYNTQSYNQYVVFDNKQIKSIDNNGLYQNDDNIFS